MERLASQHIRFPIMLTDSQYKPETKAKTQNPQDTEGRF